MVLEIPANTTKKKDIEVQGIGTEERKIPLFENDKLKWIYIQIVRNYYS